MAQLTASALNHRSVYAFSLSHRTYCYTELAVSSLALAETIANIQPDIQRVQALADILRSALCSHSK